MRRLIAVLVLSSALFMTSCVCAAKAPILENSSSIHSGAEENLIRKIAPEPVSVNDIKNKSASVNSVQLVQEKLVPSYSKKAVVLTYHHISNKPYSGITITPKRFEQDLKMLRDNNFNVISLRKMLNAVEGNDQLPKNAVVITFDDGIESFYKYAYPLLKKYNMPAVEFLITARNEAYSPSPNELNPLSPAEISEMYKSGLVDFQSHTNNSHDYVYISPEKKKGPVLSFKIYNAETNTSETDEEYLARITADLTASREVIYKYTGVYPDMLSFPFGSYSKKVITIAKPVGFKYFITTQPGYNKENSKSRIVYRIRSGDSVLSSEKLLKNIMECVNNVKKG